MVGVAAASALAASVTAARRGDISETEEAVFRRFNDAPDWLETPSWLVMQVGSLGSVFVVSGAVLRNVGPSRAGRVLAVGSAVWLGIKLGKPLVGRQRPDDLLGGVTVRGRHQTGLGFPSGHAAVSTALALAVTRSARARALALAVAAAAGASRMYVGAHLPLDVVGGMCAGALAGSVVSGVGASS